MLKISQPKVVAQSQDFIFDEVHIVGGASGELLAVVTFIVKNEKGESIGVERLEYKGEDFNTFWDNFNSGKYLYDRLVEDKELDVDVSEEIEYSFYNEEDKKVEEKAEIITE